MASGHWLVLNGGSSSIKFALFERTNREDEPVLLGKLERIGAPDAWLSVNHAGSRQEVPFSLSPSQNAAQSLVHWIASRLDRGALQGVGHRVVHGLSLTAPSIVDAAVLDRLRAAVDYDPDHLPAAIELIESAQRCFPGIVQVACFDTAFHETLPQVARLLAIPRRLQTGPVRRYGFHGISYAYLAAELAETMATKSTGRVVMAHLGSGSSMAALRDGVCVETTMGFTPAAGLPMGTRTGDLDPGVAWHLLRTGNLSPEGFSHLVNHESGLLGISETSSDMRDLEQRAVSDPRAAEAVEFYCYQARKWIGALAAVLGGIDTLVFSGGIGENSAPVREKICQGLAFLGIEIDPAANAAGAAVISGAAPGGQSRTTVRVMKTDEERMIARIARRVVKGYGTQ